MLLAGNGSPLSSVTTQSKGLVVALMTTYLVAGLIRCGITILLSRRQGM
jgi:hypothetical protein